MKWTTKKPKNNGYYWVLFLGEEGYFSRIKEIGTDYEEKWTGNVHLWGERIDEPKIPGADGDDNSQVEIM